MNKTQIIKNTVGEKLKDYGFRYLKTEGACRIFVREVHGYKRYYDPETDVVKQYINIQEHRMGKMLTVRFSTDVYGHEMMVHGLEALRKHGKGGWIEYVDESSYKESLHLLVELIIEQGLELLERISHEEEIIPTKAMADKLFNQHKELGHAFADEFHMKEIPEKTEEIDKWFCFVKKLLTDTAELPYENVKELFVRIAAFIGEKTCEICSYRWIFPEHFKAPAVVGEYSNFVPLDVIVKVWKDKNNEQLWQLMEEHAEILKLHV